MDRALLLYFLVVMIVQVVFALELTAKQGPLISAYRGNHDWNSSHSWYIENMIMHIVWVVGGKEINAKH